MWPFRFEGDLSPPTRTRAVRLTNRASAGRLSHGQPKRRLVRQPLLGAILQASAFVGPPRWERRSKPSQDTPPTLTTCTRRLRGSEI
jgi:hypothetical protein